jgi:hypothetical protein
MKLKILKIIFVFTITFILSYIFLIEPNLLKVEYINNVENPRFTIALIADIHFKNRRNFHERILKKLDEINPDLILNAGDIFSNNTDIDELKNFLKDINNIAPMISILGNWEESAALEAENIYKEIDSELLHFETTTVQKDNLSLNITGLPSKYYFKYLKNLPERTEDNINILLIHSPFEIENFPEIIDRFDYIFGAHTHGGQIYIPYITQKLMEFSHEGNYKFFKGLYDYMDSEIYITNGLGQVFPGRFLSIPEIVVLEIE